MTKLRLLTAFAFLVVFGISIFTEFPAESTTRITLNLLAVSAAGFLFGPTFLNWRK